MSVVKSIIYFDQPAAVACDAQCHKAWGVSGRPKMQLSDDPDDVCWFADDELDTAPVDPGTYEGGHAKPRHPTERLNKWCVRECERSRMSSRNELVELVDWSKRHYNQPWKHNEQ